MRALHKFALTALAMALPAAASAAVTVLDFEGLGNLEPVGDFYNGGGGGDLDITFSPASLAIIDADAGGSGNIGNEPSPDTVLFFLDANNAIVNVLNGFTTGFSFAYSSRFAATVNVYDGLNGTGNLLTSLALGAQFSDGCTGDPSGQFCNFTDVGVTFGGTALSIDFGGTANQVAFDDITFGSDIVGGPGAVPEPATWAMMIGGFGMAGGAMRARRRKTTVSFA